MSRVSCYVKMNSVDFMLSSKTINYEQRMEIKRLGRQTPDLDIAKIEVGKNRNFSRKFNSNLYDKFNWLCVVALKETNCFVLFA